MDSHLFAVFRVKRELQLRGQEGGEQSPLLPQLAQLGITFENNDESGEKDRDNCSQDCQDKEKPEAETAVKQGSQSFNGHNPTRAKGRAVSGR